LPGQAHARLTIPDASKNRCAQFAALLDEEDEQYFRIVALLDPGFAVALLAASLATPSGAIETVAPARASGIAVYAKPGGHALVRLRNRTPYGGLRRLWVRKRRGDWIKVAVEDGPNGAGWVRSQDTRPTSNLEYRIEIDRSEKRLSVIGGGSRWSTQVVIGGDVTPTPEGTFQITDRIDGARYRGVYGARILVLSAYGDREHTSRVAIHGVPPAAQSKRFSAGCIRVSRPALLRLYRQVRPGTPVRVRE
jgi:lipoprotein-anchoring transpeptidase ErfK/SrfK